MFYEVTKARVVRAGPASRIDEGGITEVSNHGEITGCEDGWQESTRGIGRGRFKIEVPIRGHSSYRKASKLWRASLEKARRELDQAMRAIPAVPPPDPGPGFGRTHALLPR